MDPSMDRNQPNTFTSKSRDEENPVFDWVEELPTADELIPLSQPLITPELSSAFAVTPEPNRTILDVHRASQNTISSLRTSGSTAFESSSSSSAIKRFPSLAEKDDLAVVEEVEDDDELDEQQQGEEEEEVDGLKDADKESLKTTELNTVETEEDGNDDSGARATRRPRLVWTPQLHKRFVDVVAHLGIKNAVPKTIMQMMNVEGLTRENVASHLQKYRLYLKRMHEHSNEEPSPSDHLFASTPSPQSLHGAPVPVAAPYVMPPGVIPMPVFGVPQNGNDAHMGIVPANGQSGTGTFHGFAPHYPYGIYGQRPGEWPGVNKIGAAVPYPSVTPPNDK